MTNNRERSDTPLLQNDAKAVKNADGSGIGKTTERATKQRLAVVDLDAWRSNILGLNGSKACFSAGQIKTIADALAASLVTEFHSGSRKLPKERG